MERITGVALKTRAGAVVSLPAPNRHHSVIRHMNVTGYSRLEVLTATQGFCTDKRPFIGRKAAARVAVKAGQIVTHKTPFNPAMLFSEDVW